MAENSVILTNNDEIVNFSYLVVNKIATSKACAALILNDPDIDMVSEEADKVFDYVYDYDYVDDTVQKEGIFVTVETDVVRSVSGTIKSLAVYVLVNCHKNYMKLDPKLFPGVKGNRRNNLIRQIDLLLNGSKEFGIGALELTRIETVDALTHRFVAKTMTYEVPNFAQKKDVRGAV